MGEHYIPLSQLLLLLNGFYASDAKRFEVHSLLFNLKLFTAKVGEDSKISEIPDRASYSRQISGLGIGEEVPRYNVYRDCLISAGVLLPVQWEEICRELLEIIDRDKLRGERSVFISLDTNALVERQYTNVSTYLKKARKDREQLKAGYVIATGVISELEKFEEKYSESDITTFKQSLGVDRELADQVFNQLKLKSRILRLGYVEYKKIAAREYFEEIESETGDIGIIKGLEQFSKAKDVDVLVLSEDSDFIEKATSHRLLGIRLDYPAELQSNYKVRWEEIAQILYTTSIIYGSIAIKGKINAKIFGIWKGKKGEHWNNEVLKVKTENRELEEFLAKNLKILEAMNRITRYKISSKSSNLSIS